MIRDRVDRGQFSTDNVRDQQDVPV
jgi:hypothetical protein